MIFNDSTNKQGLIQDIDFLTGVDINKYPLVDRTRNINSWNGTVWSWIFEVYGGWIFDDAATPTDMPTSTISLVSGTAAYALPEGTLTIRKVDVLQSDGTTWRTLAPLTLEMMGVAEGEFLKMNDTPRFYRLIGQVIKLYPTPNYSGTNYLKVFYDRGMTQFAADSTTAKPGFAGTFHRILSIGASLDYAVANGDTHKITSLTSQVLDFETRMKRLYRKRFLANFPPTIKVGDSVKQYK